MRQRGNDFERLAQAFLVEQGLSIVATNYCVPRVGEIDIIACQTIHLACGKEQSILVFVEVKMRQVSAFGQALDAITPNKRRKLIATAQHFLQNYDPIDCRFDVVAFDVDKSKRISTIWITHAFLADD